MLLFNQSLKGVNMRKFDHTDFLANAGKYALFKTAMVRNRIINEAGTVEPDTCVGLTYLGVRYNALYRREEPIYALSTGDVCYANNLHSFVL